MIILSLIIDNHQLHFSNDIEALVPEKTTIIFLHDSLGCVALWRDFPKKIASETACNIISYDRNGYGKSDPFICTERDLDYLKKEALVLGKIIDQLSLKSVILFGHSDGGSIALLAAALFPEKIIGIITEGAHVFVEEETLNGIKTAVFAYQNTNLREKLLKYHSNKTDAVFNMWAKTWLSPAFKSWNIEDCLPKIKCPALIIQGKKDEYGTIEQVNSIIENTTGESTALMLSDIGHTPHKESPEIVFKNVISFVASLPIII
ncbi:alpha/beta fold hydrolase [Aquimarina longa]|uniref:alpha/beta fold hydrolase n=1 Tax=Aquimarina longa TaxID=1080221 RepID=UPI0009EA0DA9|nr:alpha/beta hydrolase [Aquimarina longa]